MATNFITSHGMIWGEISDTGVTRSYGHDALGSVTETFVNGGLENTYRYKPYGGLLAKTGTAPDPSFLWNGGSGYRATNTDYSSYYVRRRHYAVGLVRWTTVDALWPTEQPFTYANSNPATWLDRFGTQTEVGCLPDRFTYNFGQTYCTANLDKSSQTVQVIAYRQANFAVTTKCPPGRDMCIKACLFSQQRKGHICLNRKEHSLSSSHWTDDSPYESNQRRCESNPARCQSKFETIDAAGVYDTLRTTHTVCPFTTQFVQFPENYSQFPIEYNMQYRTWASCGGQETERVYWFVRFKIFLDGAGNPQCETGNPVFSDCAF